MIDFSRIWIDWSDPQVFIHTNAKFEPLIRWSIERSIDWMILWSHWLIGRLMNWWVFICFIPFLVLLIHWCIDSSTKSLIQCLIDWVCRLIDWLICWFFFVRLICSSSPLGHWCIDSLIESLIQCLIDWSTSQPINRWDRSSNQLINQSTSRSPYQ